MLREFLFVSFLFTLCRGHGYNGFRFDYKFSKQAGGWLKLHHVPASWSDAKIRCKVEGGVLASPLTNHLQLAIIDHVVKEKGSRISAIFTGVHATFSQGDYGSIEGVPLHKLSISWASGEPDNFENSENCLVMLISNNGTMADVKCTEVYPYVCYKEKKHDLTITECGTHDTEYKLDSRTGKCYKFHPQGLTWPRAYQACVGEGAHLAIVNSEVELQVLRELFQKIPETDIVSPQRNYAALGFFDPNDGESWITIHGETLNQAGFGKWQAGEPNNASQPVGEQCGCMPRGNGNLYDYPCYWSIAFICEKKTRAEEYTTD